MTRTKLTFCLAFIAVSMLACDKAEPTSQERDVDFTSSGALAARHAACNQNYAEGARKGAASESFNSTMLWSVSPYLVLVPSTGEGFIQLNVDAKHYDWLLYTTADVEIENLGGPDLVYNGPVDECPELDLVEYGARHPETMLWQLVLRGEAKSRVQMYIGLAATDLSDPDEAGHAGHMLDEEANVLDHAGYTLDSDPTEHSGH